MKCQTNLKMADDLEDDQWLYGESNDASQETGENCPEEEAPNVDQQESNGLPSNEPLDDGPPGVDNEEKENGDTQAGDDFQPAPEGTDEAMEDGEVQQNGDESEKDDDDDSEDDVNVVIGDIKTSAPSYTQLNIKRGGLMTTVADKSKQLQQPQQTGKFSVEEFEQIGTINGVAASDYNLDSLEDKPWRKPGADITDYFNYGFNEETWRAYCERQKKMRVSESGAGLVPMNNSNINRGPIPILNDNSKYAGNYLGMNRRAGPPPYRSLTGCIDVIGGTVQRQVITPMKAENQPKMNTIQVMTADRREYSRKPNFPDMTVPPPTTYETFQPEFGFNPEPEPFYGGYEPTQDIQWEPDPPSNWQPNELKTLTGPPPMAPPPITGAIQLEPIRSPRRESPLRDRDRERDRDSRGRSERDRDRDRERSHRRERSRSRSRRHKSRSKSPSHRSHRKKKSRRHDDSE